MFSKKDWKYIVLFAGAVILMTVSEYIAPKPIDWSRSYAKSDKNPYGNYILFDRLTDIFGEQDVKVNRITAYEADESGAWSDYTSIIYINDKFSPSKLETEVLMDCAAQGKHIFIAASSFDGVFADTFDIKVNRKGFARPFQGEEEAALEGTSINFINPDLITENGYFYKKGTTSYYFDQYDEHNGTLLGQDVNEFANFIRIKHGLGYFYLHTNPLVFTNYNLLLDNNYDYVAKALSYLPKENIVWDEYYKSGRVGASTPLRFFLSQPSLKWAWLIAISAVCLFVIFNIKRKQRIIPIIEPPSNTTLEFVETIGRLYYQNKDHQDMARKKVRYFKDYIRQHFFITIHHWSEVEQKQLAAKSGLELEQIKKLATIILQATTSGNGIDERILINLCTHIDQFKIDTAGPF